MYRNENIILEIGCMIALRHFFYYSFPCALAIKYMCMQHDLNKLALVVESSSLSIANRINHMMDW